MEMSTESVVDFMVISIEYFRYIIFAIFANLISIGKLEKSIKFRKEFEWINYYFDLMEANMDLINV